MIEFAKWINGSPLNALVTGHDWIIPAVQSVHILTICMLMGSVLMMELRLAGLAFREQTLKETSARFIPWVWGCLVVLLSSGIVMTIGEPFRQLGNQTFWNKMILILVASAPTLAFQLWVRKRADTVDSGGGRKVLAVAGLAVLIVWALVCVAGRFIAYSEYSEG